MEHIPAEVYIELGAAGLTADEVHALMAKAGRLADDQHQMGAEGRVPIPGTKRVFVYNGGIDGMDWRVYIEDAAIKAADVLVREALLLLQRHRNGVSYGYGSSPNFAAWEKEAQRYVKSQEPG